MKGDETQIRKGITKCLADSNLPKEVSLDNENVLKLLEYKNHHSLVFVDKLLFRVLLEKGECVLELQREYEKFFPGQEDLSGKWLRVHLKSVNEIDRLKDSIVNILAYELKRTHGEAFGCCSKYMECSDSRNCIHDNFLFSLCCQYRLNLLENNIFYGKNATL
jgi:hypothetical protein